MTKAQLKDQYLQERYKELRVHYPYGFDVRQSDGAVRFFNRDYAPLQEDFVKLPECAMNLIREGADQNGSQFSGFDSFWYYDDGTSPANNIGKNEERDFIWKMMKMGRQLMAYGLPSDMYFAKVYPKSTRWGDKE